MNQFSKEATRMRLSRRASGPAGRLQVIAIFFLALATHSGAVLVPCGAPLGPAILNSTVDEELQLQAGCEYAVDAHLSMWGMVESFRGARRTWRRAFQGRHGRPGQAYAPCPSRHQASLSCFQPMGPLEHASTPLLHLLPAVQETSPLLGLWKGNAQSLMQTGGCCSGSCAGA